MHGTLFVAVRIKNGRASTKLLKKPATMRGWCVHRIGGSTATNLTAARRKSVIAKHRTGVADGDCHCKYACKGWTDKLRRTYNKKIKSLIDL